MNSFELEHDARLHFDRLVRELIASGATVEAVLATVRRIAKDGNGWTPRLTSRADQDSD